MGPSDGKRSSRATVRDAMTDTPRLATLSIMQAADRLDISRHQMIELIERGHIASHRVGWSRVVSVDAVKAFESEHLAGADLRGESV